MGNCFVACSKIFSFSINMVHLARYCPSAVSLTERRPSFFNNIVYPSFEQIIGFCPADLPRGSLIVITNIFFSVSQIDNGIVYLTNKEDPRITVLLDCHGISPFRFPMQMMRSFITIVQENYPNRLGVLFIVRLPPVVRVIAQTLIQVTFSTYMSSQ